MRVMKMRLSPSKLNTFLGCPASYKAKYIDMMTDGSGQAAVNGTCCHTAFDYFYAENSEDTSGRTLARALECLDRALAEWPLVTAFVPEPEKCQELIWNLFDLEDPTTVNARRTEMDMLVDWYGDHQLRGIIDRVDVEDDGYVLVDYKTGKAPSDEWMGEKLTQLKLYALMGQIAFGKLPKAVRLLFLGTPQTVEVKITESMVRGVDKRARAAVDSIERGQFETNPSRSACMFCPAKDTCKDAYKKPLTGGGRKRKVNP